MKTPPEAFLIFREELEKAKLEKKKLEKEYEAKVKLLNQELSYLKEQVTSQQDMIIRTMDYVSKLETDLHEFQIKVAGDQKKSKHSSH